MSLRVHRYTVASYLAELARELRDAEARWAERWGALYFDDRRYRPLMSIGAVAT